MAGEIVMAFFIIVGVLILITIVGTVLGVGGMAISEGMIEDKKRENQRYAEWKKWKKESGAGFVEGIKKWNRVGRYKND